MTKSKNTAAAASALLLAFSVSPVGAQTGASPPPTKLPPVIVTGQPAGSLTVPGVEQQREQLYRTPGSVGFVDSEEYKGRYAGTLREVLADMPGVFVQNRYGQELRLSIRGSGIARGFHTRGIEVLQDGIPTNLADGSGDFYQIDPLSLRSVEIYKGGNGLAYGSSTLGGAINFVTPTAYTAIAPNILRLDGGSFNTIRGSGQVSRVFGNFDALAAGTVTHSDGYRQHSRTQAEVFNGNAGYRFNDTVETRFYLGSYLVDQQLPGAVTLSDALRRPTAAGAAQITGDQRRNTETVRVANRTAAKLDVGTVTVDTWAIHKNLFHPIFQVIDEDGWTYGIAPRYTGSFEIGGFRNDLFTGLRAIGGNNDSRRFINVAGRSGANTLNARQTAGNYEAYLENHFFFLPTVALMTGVKALHDERRYTDVSVPRNSATRSYDGLNPKLGLLWEPRPDIQAFVDVTRSQDVPDFTDLTQTQVTGAVGFVPLAPQRGYTLEAGTRGQTDRFGWDVTLYQARLRNEMLQFNTNPSFPASTFNARNTIHQGVELGFRVDLLRDIAGPDANDRLTWRQLWNLSDFKFDHDLQFANNQIAGVPKHVLRTAVTYAHGSSGFYVTPVVDWVPAGAYADNANALRAPGYTLLGLQSGIDFENGISLFLDARNLTDKRYITDISTILNARAAGANTAVFYPGDGASAFAGIRFAF
jgi:iron complex outermembrane receptor protein